MKKINIQFFSLFVLWIFILNVFSRKIDIEFYVIANNTYQKVLPCVMSSKIMQLKSKSNLNLEFPIDGENHYKELLAVTEKYRNISFHQYFGYNGPWIENLFINQFIDLPLSYFNGLIPLFVQWIDILMLSGDMYGQLTKELSLILRPNVIYFAISQHDGGLHDISRMHPNIIVFAGGGLGHIPIPMILGNLDYHHTLSMNFTHMFSFFGTIHPNREAMLSVVSETSKLLGVSYLESQGQFT